jgi:hypothetical protein
VQLYSRTTPTSETCHEFDKDSMEDKPTHEHGEGHHLAHSRKEDEINRIDPMATAQATTLGSFAHLDEKKILRKVCPKMPSFAPLALMPIQMDVRLIPMLAILYLLSFLDRATARSVLVPTGAC